MFFNNCNCNKTCCVRCAVQHDHRDCGCRNDNDCNNDRGCGCKCCCCRQKQCCEMRPQCPYREAQRNCGCGAYGNSNGWNNNGWNGNGGHGNGCGCSGNI